MKSSLNYISSFFSPKPLHTLYSSYSFPFSRNLTPLRSFPVAVSVSKLINFILLMQLEVSIGSGHLFWPWHGTVRRGRAGTAQKEQAVLGLKEQPARPAVLQPSEQDFSLKRKFEFKTLVIFYIQKCIQSTQMWIID
ncbi:unnamed protein product, partial [Vitis vinifera]